MLKSTSFLVKAAQEQEQERPQPNTTPPKANQTPLKPNNEPLKPYKHMKEPDNADLREEFKQEIYSAFVKNSTAPYYKRWPGMKQRPSFFSSPEKFIEAVHQTTVTEITEQQFMKIHNLSSAQQTLKDKRQGAPDSSEEFFKDPIAVGKEREWDVQPNAQTCDDGIHNKADSYKHKVDLIRRGEAIAYPVLLRVNGLLCHVTAGTRQSAAVANGYILPVKILKI
mgnify:CR=1 FL=1